MTELQKRLSQLTQDDLRAVAEQNNFCFYSLLEIQQGTMKVSKRHEQRIIEALEKYK